MPVRDKKRILDGFTEVGLGMDSGRDPCDIERNQVAFAVNVTVRGGKITCRPGYWKRALDFQTDATLQTNFEDGRWQGASEYVFGQESHLVACISGRQFKLKTDDYKVSEITPQDGPGNTRAPNNSLLPRVWFAQAEDFLIIQDGQSKALIYNGATCRRSIASNAEVPVGTVMAYGWGRLWVASPTGQFFVAGDLVYGSSGTAPYDFRDSVLRFTENTFLNGGGSFSIPMTAGPITAMKFTASIGGPTGQGPLQVFTQMQGFSVDAPVDRTTWQNLTYPIQSVDLFNYGPTCQNVVAMVNSDLWFRSVDGVRSFRLAQRFFTSDWVNTSQSKEMDGVLPYDSTDLLSFGSAVLFDNRLLTTTSPTPTSQGIIHRGLAVLDFNPVTSMRERAQPAWEGIWTGLNVLQILTAGNRCFMFALSSDNKIELWELSRFEKFDHPDEATDTPIQWSFDSRSMEFATQGYDRQWELKELGGGDRWIDQVVGPVTITYQFRPDQYPAWQDWHSEYVCATYKDCAKPGCEGPKNSQIQYRPRYRLPLPPDVCEVATGKSLRLGYEFQARVKVTGHCRIIRFRLVAYERQEDVMGQCDTESTCAEENVCVGDAFTYLLN